MGLEEAVLKDLVTFSKLFSAVSQGILPISAYSINWRAHSLILCPYCATTVHPSSTQNHWLHNFTVTIAKAAIDY